MRRATDLRPILIGEAPSRTGDRFHDRPLSGAVARTLCCAAGFEPAIHPSLSEEGRWTLALYERFECLNLVERYAQASPWPRGFASLRAAEIVLNSRTAPTVLLGRRVAHAFMLEKAEFGEWRLLGSRRIVVVPHPSGKNRMLNSAANVDLLGIVLRQAVAFASGI